MTGKQCKVLFRVDASPSIGGGHVMRCIALASAFKRLGHICHFLATTESGDYFRALELFEFELVLVPPQADNTQANDESVELSFINDLAAERGYSIFVMDGYHFSDVYLARIKCIAPYLLLFDDGNLSLDIMPDAIISPTMGISQKRTRQGVLQLAGPSYVLLRPEFQAQMLSSFESRNELVINFGASDAADLSTRVMHELLRQKPASLRLTLITGAAYKGLSDIKVLLSEADTNTKHCHNVSNMADSFSRAGMAISAAGGTTFELGAMAVPSILVVVANNQKAAAMQQANQGWCKIIDARKGLDVQQLVSQALALWRNENERKSMYSAAIKCDFFGGADRAVKRILCSSGF